MFWLGFLIGAVCVIYVIGAIVLTFLLRWDPDRTNWEVGMAIIWPVSIPLMLFLALLLWLLLRIGSAYYWTKEKVTGDNTCPYT